MGQFFSNLHIRKKPELCAEDIKKYFIAEMQKKGYALIDNADEEAVRLLIYAPEESGWISIASEETEFSSYDDANNAAAALLRAFSSPVIAALCLDSDYLLLDLVSNGEKKDGILCAGRPEGMIKPVRKRLSPFKGYVTDFSRFRQIADEEYVMAEEAFCEAAPLFGMKAEQCSLCPENIGEADSEGLEVLYFTPPAGMEKEKPEFKIWHFCLVPCRMDEDNCVFVVNEGGRSKGLKVIFTGDYIENDDLVFENVRITARGYEKKIELIRGRDKDGKALLYYEDNDIVIPKALSRELPEMKRMNLELDRIIAVRFNVRGNERKLLDIKVWMIPLENPAGADVWYVYRLDGSKRAYIEDMNSDNPEGSPFYIDPQRYDLE